MKNLASLLFLACCSTASGFAQNLVPNPSFEEYVNCPNDYGESFELVDWFRALATPDYFNTCDGVNDTCGVPKNFAGYQLAASGLGYIGMVTYSNDPPQGFRELIGVRLEEALMAGVTYNVSLKISWTSSFPSPDGWTKYAANRIGIRMRSDSLVGDGAWYPIDNVAQFASDSIVTDSVGWSLLSGYFTAVDNSSWLYVGNFFDHSSVAASIVDPNCPDEQGYYYVDDICLSAVTGGCIGATNIQRPQATSVVNAWIRSESIEFSGLRSDRLYRYEILDITGKLIEQGAMPSEARIPFSTTHQMVLLRIWDGSEEQCFKLPVLYSDL